MLRLLHRFQPVIFSHHSLSMGGSRLKSLNPERCEIKLKLHFNTTFIPFWEIFVSWNPAVARKSHPCFGEKLRNWKGSSKNRHQNKNRISAVKTAQVVCSRCPLKIEQRRWNYSTQRKKNQSISNTTKKEPIHFQHNEKRTNPLPTQRKKNQSTSNTTKKEPINFA